MGSLLMMLLHQLLKEKRSLHNSLMLWKYFLTLIVDKPITYRALRLQSLLGFLTVR
ncbi:hypothetical protein BN1200_840025 [Klebsiella variicola]|nr:hypothetical protein BN1200_840025 [Klebsiella variicola]